MKEIWKPIPEYEDLYDVSNIGRVQRMCDGYHCKNGDILKGGISNFGYIIIGLRKNDRQTFRSVHRLVLFAFIGPCPEGMEGSHLNDIKTDNRLENLAWMTHSENCRLAFKNGRSNKGKNNSMFGKCHSKKSRRKMSMSHQGKHHSKETKRKLSSALIGNKNGRKLK